MSGKPFYPGHAPWEEVWFLELPLDDGGAIWVRSLMRDGVDGQAETWAVLTDPDGTVHGRWAARPLYELRMGASPFIATPDGEIGPRHARGQIDDVSWQLELGESLDPYRMVPERLEQAGLGRTYASVRSRVRVTGSVNTPSGRRQVSGAGVLGHIHGARSRVKRWAWGHVCFDDGTTLETLGAQLAFGATQLPTTSVHLAHPDAPVSFTKLTQLVCTRTRMFADGWDVRATDARHVLRADFRFSTTPTMVRYTAPDGVPSWCRNSPAMRVRLTVRRDGLPWLNLASDRGVGELGSKRRHGPEPVLLPPTA